MAKFEDLPVLRAALCWLKAPGPSRTTAEWRFMSWAMLSRLFCATHRSQESGEAKAQKMRPAPLPS